ncbi:hypothetical protein BOX15_Mlig003022g3 [Macrostomum lignano]|uniref:Uncharacterized protein n=1 Tax=Macrostomum lignano TaxID=282301 RepID=A0A267GG17_9PLAT|nr:hypothetical protein BOX15_Mlig003022g2 [Macrostomum lignano]PAA70489.1 hypothetical protein BOX15_Mlig003022g1 [Macrostomum lignano]PAA84990.1 hypothetical protein BOX15_Mlig003022g3 [Macrostomum lignano]
MQPVTVVLPILLLLATVQQSSAAAITAGDVDSTDETVADLARHCDIRRRLKLPTPAALCVELLRDRAADAPPDKRAWLQSSQLSYQRFMDKMREGDEKQRYNVMRYG